MGFKFLNTEQIPDVPDHITQERFNELVGYQLTLNTHNPLSVDDRPAVFLNLNRRREDIPELEWNYILERQRRSLIEFMWNRGNISHTIISQDESGFTLRTEINF